jgi:hypothetical protein
MSKLGFSILMVVGMLWATAHAQTETDSVELQRSMIETERKMIVAKNLDLSDEEGEAFWKVYNDFQRDLREVGDKRIKLLKEFRANFEGLTDEKARELLDGWFEFREERVSVSKAYVKKFLKVLPARKVARYYQIENKLQTLIEFDVARSIPLVR